MVNLKKKVLMVSANFSGGGLETRINNIVNKFHTDYSFSLITKTLPKDMKIKPSSFIKDVYSWNKYSKALLDVNIVDVHPFGVSNIIKEWNIQPHVKKIYTLHGKLSLDENLEFLKDYDYIYVVSKKLISCISEKYPSLKDKVFLSKNRVNVKENISEDGRNILFSLSNTGSRDFIQDIIDLISPKHTIHFIGYFKKGSFVRNVGKIIYHGFVNVNDFFKNNNFDMVFVRGGFAAMDVIIRNVPCLCIYAIDEKQERYFEAVSCDNFSRMSDCNFVVDKLFNKEDFIKVIESIEKCPDNYRCRDLLLKYNDIENMEDLYKDL